MKKNLQALLCCLVVLFAFNTKTAAQGTLIHYWDFNNYNTTYNYPQVFPIGPLDADFSIHDTSKARVYMDTLHFASTSWHNAASQPIVMDPYPTTAADFDTANLQLGQPAGNALRPRNPMDSGCLKFFIPTVNYQNIKFSYDCESSSTTSGDTYQYYDYSIDSGHTWITTGLSQPYDSAWTIFHLAAVTISNPAVNNNPKLVFRIHFVGDNTGTKGNDRFDNVTVWGDSIISPVPIHYWNYNSFSTTYNYPTAPPFSINADFSLIDVTKARTVFNWEPGTSAAYHNAASQPIEFDFYPTTAVDSDNYNLLFGATGGNSIRPRNPLDSAYLYFYVPSTGYHNLTFSYTSESSSTTSGDTYNYYDYSTDSGTTWKNALLSQPRDSAYLYFHQFNVTFTSDSSVNNNPKLVFRIRFVGDNTGTKGNDRFDNVSLTGIPYISSNSITTTAAAYGPFCNASGNPISVAFTSAGSYTGTWQVQLSSPGGTFANNTSNIIGTGIGSPITATIPTGTAPGSYRVRVLNTAPATSGGDNGSNIVINGPPSAYNVTGGGGFCSGGGGVPVGLSGSQTGVKYQLYLNTSTAEGGAVPGTNGVITFGNQTLGGGYTVVATNTVTPTCTSNMTGSVNVTVNPVPSAIAGPTTICSNNSVFLTNTVPGGSWASNSTFVASVNGSTGQVSAYATGLAIITYTLPGGCFTTANIIVNSAVPAIEGTTTVCPGAITTLSDASGSGTWSSDNISLATVDEFGDVSGVAAGNVNISYIVSPGCITSTSVTVYSLPSAISGATNVCTGLTTTLNDVDGTGSWSSSDNTTASIDPSAGTVIGILAGTVTISYTEPTGCSITTPFTVNPLPDAIVGSDSVCQGLTTTLSDDGGGTWSNDNTSVATVNAGTGTVLGTAAGTTNITYTLPTGCITSAPFVVNPLPSTITGTENVCAGLTTSLGDPDGSGSWSTSSLLATVDPASGIVSGISAGTATITYMLPTTCITTATVVVNPLPAAISGNLQVCQGLSTTLSDAGAGTWASSDPSTASIDAGSGLVNGLAAGSVTITYTLPTGCINTSSFVVNPLPDPITGSNVVCAGTTTSLGDDVSGGTWSSSNHFFATAGLNTGIVSGVSAGVATITYKLGTNCLVTTSVTVNPLPATYLVTGGGSYCEGATGASIGLSGSNAGISYQLIYSSAPLGSPVTSTGGPINFGSFTGAGNYTVVATNIGTSCAQNMNGMATIGINGLPSVYAVTGGGSFCAGSSGEPVGLSGSTSGIHYQLMRGTTPVGIPLSGAGSPLAFGIQASAGNYTVVATNPATGCTDNMASTATIVVNSLPNAYSVTGGGNYCGGSGGLHIGLSGSTSGVYYQLFYGITLVGSPKAGTGLALDYGAFTTDEIYHVVATDSTTGCSATMPGTVEIVTDALPLVHNVTGGGSYCATGSGVHIGLDGSNMGISYQLHNGGVPVGSSALGSVGPVDFGLMTDTGTYYAVATNIVTGCSSNMAGSANVVVNPMVTPTVSLSTGMGDTICSGHYVTITSTATNTGTSPLYAWTVNGASVSAGGVYSYIPSEGDHVVVRLTSSTPCASPATVYGSLNLTVLASGAPTAHITSSSGSAVCSGTTVNFNSFTTNGGPFPALIWLVNNVPAGSGASYSYYPVNHDAITALLISDYFCRVGDSATSNSIAMEVDNPTPPVVTITPNPVASVAYGQTVTLSATATNAGPSPTYQWLVNGMPVPGATFPTYSSNSFFNGDSVTCLVFSSGGCPGIEGNKSVTIHVAGTGVQQIVSSGSDVRLVPNPNKGIFSLKGSLGTSGDRDATITITNMLGQVVYSSSFVVRDGKVDEQVALNSTLANGMYLLNLRSGDQNNVFHFVLEQ